MKQEFNKASSSLTEAEIALKEWGCRYEKQEDGTIYVRGSLDLKEKGLAQLPDLSNVVVEGWFECGFNNLTSLKGAPRECRNFCCSGNKLESIEYAPRVTALFYCINNNLTHLEPMPENYAILMTDWGNFTMANPPPDEIRYSAQTRQRKEEEKTKAAVQATILQSDMSVRRPLKLRHAGFQSI
jgi:hypothetical protein